jgi:DNA-binding CsgD family transcriptional regulator
LSWVSRSDLEQFGRVRLAARPIRKRTAEHSTQLTAQKAQIARLVREGLSNPEIGARLFISPRTVEWHLSKISGKLGISSHRQLRSSAQLPRVAVSSGPPGGDQGSSRVRSAAQTTTMSPVLTGPVKDRKPMRCQTETEVSEGNLVATLRLNVP